MTKEYVQVEGEGTEETVETTKVVEKKSPMQYLKKGAGWLKEKIPYGIAFGAGALAVLLLGKHPHDEVVDVPYEVPDDQDAPFDEQ